MFVKMLERGLVPNEVTYTSMMYGYIMMDRVDAEFSPLRQMVCAGYSVIMKGILKEQQVIENNLAAVANSISTCSLHEKDLSIDIGYELNVDDYGNLVCGLCGEG